MAFYAGETGRTIRLNAGYDLQSNTDVKIVFVAPDSTIYEKGSADGVTVSSINVADPVLGDLNAYEYVEYESEPELFQVQGTWRLYLKYENHSITPEENLYGDPVRVIVKPRAESVTEEGCACG